MKKIVFLHLVLIVCINSDLFAHAINFETRRNSPTVTVKAYFSRTAPLAGATVEIFAPGGEQPYQTGRSDREGNFAFIPNTSGGWKVVVDDERGHTGQVIVSITDDFFEVVEEAASPAGMIPEPYAAEAIENETAAIPAIPLIYRVIFGISLIASITSMAYALRLRQELSSRSQES